MKQPSSTELIALATPAGPPRRDRQIFCNRDLNLSGVSWIGFDMDYTLAIYHRDAFDALCHDLTLKALVRDFAYPESILSIPFDPNFAVRGLVIDMEKGHILKLDSHLHVGKGTHGKQRINDEQRAVYRKQPPQLGSDRYRLLDTLFELPEATIYAELIEGLDALGRNIDFGRLAEDIRSAIDSIHADGSLKAAVTRDLPKYIEKDRDLPTMLHKMRSSGKRLFLMTNSFYEYTDRVMSYLLDPQGTSYTDWKSYFDVIITGAKKPSFFGSRTPFSILNDDGQVTGTEHTQLQRGVVYQHGNLHDFERMIGLGADEILYIGDHIYGDILRSKRDSAWRTVMIIPEMEAEMNQARATNDLAEQWRLKDAELRKVDDERHWDAQLLEQIRDQRKFSDPTGGETQLDATERQVERRLDAAKKRYRELLADLVLVEQSYDASFHPIWGSLFKEGNENSIFGQQVELYACLYTSRASNFFHVSPVSYFRSPRTLLPHEHRTDFT